MPTSKSGHRSARQKSPAKKAWRNPEITRIRLNPEQAVLACCSVGTKSVFNNPVGSMCWINNCGTGGSISAVNT